MVLGINEYKYGNNFHKFGYNAYGYGYTRHLSVELHLQERILIN